MYIVYIIYIYKSGGGNQDTNLSLCTSGDFIVLSYWETGRHTMKEGVRETERQRQSERHIYRETETQEETDTQREAERH